MADQNNSNKANLSLQISGFNFNTKSVGEISVSIDTDTTDAVYLGITPQTTEALENLANTVDKHAWLRNGAMMTVDILSARAKRIDRVNSIKVELEAVRLEIELAKARFELNELRSKKS
jgi:hypothetical protein